MLSAFRVSVLAICFLFCSSTGSWAGTIGVPSDFPTIQEAIEAAQDGDCVLVAPGTYVENIDFLGKGIIVQSNDGPAVTIIDGNQAGSVVTFATGEGPDSVLDGFTITNGSGTDTFFGTAGGGIYCDTTIPIVQNNIVTGNTIAQGLGGGIYGSVAEPLILNNVISENSVLDGSGGGILMEVDSFPLISGNIINDNTASGSGGGIACRVIGNAVIVNNMIFRNVVGENGGGIDIDELSDPTILCNTIAENSSGVRGGGIFNETFNLPLTNSILWGNDAPEGAQIFLQPGTNIVVTFCDVQGGWPGQGNIDADPQFVSSGDDDFHIQVGSPCVGAGTNGVFQLPATDIDGDPRIQCDDVDIGADETPACGGGPDFVRGDASGDGVFNGLVDALFILAFQFQGGSPPVCIEAADADGSGLFNGLVDALYVLAHQFQGGPPPAAPYPDCGPDPDPTSSLGCGPNACP